jgi:carbonic anhydrase/acetyltransferase-like protein (isoleucine patch superfamily)/8-oxo-dGTP pyrophosphatase MutT (NUDIX family)
MVKSDKKIEPFNEHPQDCLIANRKLRDLQRESLEELGIELKETSHASQIHDKNEHLIFNDRLLFTAELVKEFLAKSRRLKSNTVCALKPGLTTTRTIIATQDIQIHPDRIEYDLTYVPAATAPGQRVPVVIDADESVVSILMPKHMFGEREYNIPMTDRIIIQIDHWANLWAACMGVLLSEGAKLNKVSKIRQLGLAIKTRAFNRWEVLHHLDRIGRNCDIHPTSYLEFSTIGDNVTVGAGCVIRESIVGDGTFIGDNATIELSVLGEGCHIRSGSVISYSTCYPGTFIDCHLVELSLCGRDTFIGGGVVLTDFRLDGKHVTVMKGETMIDTGNTFLGSCIGHGVYLGAGSIVAPGRAIPNGMHLVPEVSRIITNCTPEDIPGYRRLNQSGK